MAAIDYSGLAGPLALRKVTPLSATIGNAQQINLPTWCKAVMVEFYTAAGATDGGKFSNSGTDATAIGANVKSIEAGERLIIAVWADGQSGTVNDIFIAGNTASGYAELIMFQDTQLAMTLTGTSSSTPSPTPVSPGGIAALNSLFGDAIVAERFDLVNIDWAPGRIDPLFVRAVSQYDFTVVVGGPFTAGELIVGGTSGALGQLSEAVAGDQVGTVERESLTGFTSGETVTGLASGATATMTLNAHGTASVVNSNLTLDASTATDTIVYAQSFRQIAYQAGHDVIAQFDLAFPDGGLAATTMWQGYLGPSNGFAIGYNGVTLSVLTRNAGVDTPVAQASWNIDPLDGTGVSGYTLNATKYNVYRIQAGYGVLGCLYMVLGSDRKWKPFHFTSIMNSSVALVISNPNLGVRAEITKVAAAATSVRILSSTWEAGTVGAGSTNPDYLTSVALRGVSDVIPLRVKGFALAISAVGTAWPYYATQAAVNLPAARGTGTVAGLFSTSSLDKPTGTGAKSAQILYLDVSGNLQDKVLFTSGTTLVSLGVAITAVLGARVLSVGSGGASAGTLLVSNGAKTEIYFAVGAGTNLGATGIAKVPNGYGLSIYSASISTAESAVSSRPQLVVQSTRGLTGQELEGTLFQDEHTELSPGGRFVTFDPPIRIPQNDWVRLTAQRNAGGGTVDVAMELNCVLQRVT